MEWLNFHHLRYFWTVAKTASVRRAAEQLHVSQPSISAQLKLLEETLGQKLFQRSGRNLVLTEFGQLVLSYADEIFSIGRELMSAVKQRPGNRALRFNVGMTELNIPYEIKNVTSNPAYAEELKTASGQCMRPSIDVDGTMLADASVEDLAKVLEQRGLIIQKHPLKARRSRSCAIDVQIFEHVGGNASRQNA